MLNDSMALCGSDTERYIRGLYADKCFMSARGISPDGEISDSSKAERDVKLAMLERCEKKYFLFDSSKYGLHFQYRIAVFSDFDQCITL